MRTLIAGVILGTFAIALPSYTYDEKTHDSYITAPVERGRVTTIVKAIGTITPHVMVEVGSQLSGQISEVLVNFNDSVKAGEVIARVRPDSYIAAVSGAKADLRIAEAAEQQQKAALQSAKLAVENARTARQLAESQLAAAQIHQKQLESDLKRNLILAKTKAVSDQVVSQSRSLVDVGAANLEGLRIQLKMKSEAIEVAGTQLSMAEANLQSAGAVVEQKQAAVEKAEVDLQQTKIRSPIDGIVILRQINPGQTVAVSLESKTLFKISDDLHEMEVDGRIDEADIGKIKVGQKVNFTVDAYPNKVFQGRIVQVRKSPEISQNVVTYTAVASAANPHRLLFPGMTAYLHIIVAETKDTIMIPNKALNFRPAGYKNSEQPAANVATVWVVSGPGKASPVQVTIGKTDESSTQVLAGNLTTGDRVVIGQTSSGEREKRFFDFW